MEAVNQPPTERPPLPIWLRDQIRTQSQMTAYERKRLGETVMRMLDDGVLLLAEPDQLTPEQLAFARVNAPKTQALAPSQLLAEQSEARRNAVLLASRLDRFFLGRALTIVEVRAGLQLPRNTGFRNVARQILHEVTSPGTEHITPQQRIQEEMIRRCLECAVARDCSAPGGAINADALSACALLPRKATRQTLARLASRPEPVVAVKDGARTSYVVTEQGATLQDPQQPAPPRWCQELSFVPRGSARRPRPTTPKDPAAMPLSRPSPPTTRRRPTGPIPKVQQAVSEIKPVAGPTVRSRRLSRYIEWYCQGKSPETRVELTKAICRSIEEDLIELAWLRAGETRPYEAAPMVNDRYLRVGRALRDEIEPVQKALMYSMGLSRLIYGETITFQELSEELGLLPLDELDAYIALFWRNVAQQKAARQARKKPASTSGRKA